MSQTMDLPDIALMLRVRKDDAVAFEVLHDRYQRQLLNFFYGMSRHAPTSSDLCQETFLRVWQARRRYRATGTFPAYLFGIARMVWREHCRRAFRDGQMNEALPEWSPAHEPRAEARRAPDYLATCSEVETEVLAALQQLPEDQRMVFVMRTIRGLSLPDIASAMDCPVNTVRSRKILGIKRLRRLLDGMFHRQEDRILEEDRQR